MFRHVMSRWVAQTEGVGLPEGVRVEAMRLAGEMMVEAARDEGVRRAEVTQAILARRRSLQTPVVSANTQA